MSCPMSNGTTESNHGGKGGGLWAAVVSRQISFGLPVLGMEFTVLEYSMLYTTLPNSTLLSHTLLLLLYSLLSPLLLLLLCSTRTLINNLKSTSHIALCRIRSCYCQLPAVERIQQLTLRTLPRHQ